MEVGPIHILRNRIIMPLRFKDAPTAAAQQLSQAFELWSNREWPPFFEAAANTTFRPVFPHAVYTLGLNQVLNRDKIAEAARHVSWRYLIPQPSPASAVEISVSGREPKFSELNYG